MLQVMLLMRRCGERASLGYYELGFFYCIFICLSNFGTCNTLYYSFI